MDSTVLYIEYEEILLGHRNSFSTLNRRANDIYYPPLIRHALEDMIGWDAKTIRERLNMGILKALKLDVLLSNIELPLEVDLNEDCYYLVHLMYPHEYRYNRVDTIERSYRRVLEKGEKIRKGLFSGEKGRDAARICLRYVITNMLPVMTTEDLYKLFANSLQARKTLAEYSLQDACDRLYKNPLDYLHDSLEAPVKNDLYYHYYRFRTEYRRAKKEVEQCN